MLFNSKIIPLTAAVAIFSLSAGYFVLAWSEPSGSMPVTVDAPINTGSTEQTKKGNLNLEGTLKVKDFVNFPNPVRGTFLGYSAGGDNTTGASNTFIGYESGPLNTTASANTAVGFRSLYSNSTGGFNTAIGYHSLYGNTNGNNNIAIGAGTMYANATGTGNVAIGNYALNAGTAPNSNIAIGQSALSANTTGYYNVAVGVYALAANKTSPWNTAVGATALANNTGNSNTAIGYLSMEGNNTGTANTALGFQSLRYNATSSWNTAVGWAALLNNKQTSNTALGSWALSSDDWGWGNVAIGSDAGRSITTGQKNTFLGLSAGYNPLQKVDAVNSMALGNGTYNTADNQVVIGNLDIKQTLLRGNVGINNSNPTSTLSVNGDVSINGNLLVNGSPVSGGGGSGGGVGSVGPQFLVSVLLFDPYDNNVGDKDPVSTCNKNWDPASKKLSIICEEEGVGKVINAQSSLSNPVVTSISGKTDPYYHRIEAVNVGDVFCTSYERYDDEPILICSKGSKVSRYCQEGHTSCINDGYPFLPGSAGGDLYLSAIGSDGTYLYASKGSYKYKFSFDAAGNMALVEHGTSVSIPSIGGVSVFNTGDQIPYDNVIYKAELVPQYTYYSNGSHSYVKIFGFTFLLLNATGTY